MISRLRGTLVARRAQHCVVDVGGVGYRVTTPPNAKLPARGEAVELEISTYVREDAFVLYGFPDEDTRDLFELLLGCQGVGPKVALACLSVLSSDALVAAVRTQDIASLTVVPGIGKRSAEKLIFELGPKLGADSVVPESAGAHSEVRDALGGLGYGDKEIGRALAAIPDGGDTGELLRAALRALGKDE